MTTLLERLASAFVAPRTVDAPVVRRRAAVAPAVAVLSNVDDVVAAGSAAAQAVARECRAPVAAVCVWTGGEAAPARLVVPASAAAQRLARALSRRGHAARASRRLVHVTLPPGEGEAAAEAARVAAACGAAPVVLALAGARGTGFDAALRGCDLVVVTRRREADPALASLALAGLESLGVRAIECDAPAAALARRMAASGAALTPSARSAIRPVLEALR